MKSNFQFSLKKLLFAFVLVAVAMCVISSWYLLTQAPRIWIAKSSEYVDYDERTKFAFLRAPDVEYAEFTGQVVDSSFWLRMADLRSVRSVSFDECKFSTSDLADDNLSGVLHISFSRCEFSGSVNENRENNLSQFQIVSIVKCRFKGCTAANVAACFGGGCLYFEPADATASTTWLSGQETFASTILVMPDGTIKKR